VGSPTTLPSTSFASLVMTKGRMASSMLLVLPAAWWTSPSRPYPIPVMEKRSVGSMTSTTVTWFIVSVPVLSELIADVEPRVSTESRLLTTAPWAASSREPLDKITCSTVGIAIGTAASASAIAVVKITCADSPRECPSTNMMMIVRPAAPAIHRVNVSSCLVMGVLTVGADFSMPEMAPTAVLAPVAVTIITPLPCVTGVFMNAMFD
jgi:hypothetical protein